MQDVVVVEAADDMDDRIGLANVGEKLVAQSLTLARSLDQAGDVHELHGGRNGALRLHHLGQCVEAIVGNVDAADVRILGRERIVRGKDPGAGEGVEERRFADVGESDDAESEHGMDDGRNSAVTREAAQVRCSATCETSRS